MAHAVMAYIVMAYTVMAGAGVPRDSTGEVLARAHDAWPHTRCDGDGRLAGARAHRVGLGRRHGEAVAGVCRQCV